MASRPNPVTSPSPVSLSTESHLRDRSKAQMCLFKILRIISLFPAVDISYKQPLTHRRNTGFDVDLNIGLGPPTEVEPMKYPMAATSGAGYTDCVSVKNNLSFFAEKPNTVEEQSEISHVGDQSSGTDCNGFSDEVGEKVRDEGYLDLLIEAAELILGTEAEASRSNYLESATTAEKGGAKRKKQCWTEWYGELEDTSPVVKSKRGRNQVLPFKYRDSIMEPLVWWPSSRQRSNSDAAAVPSKRRSK